MGISVDYGYICIFPMSNKIFKYTPLHGALVVAQMVISIVEKTLLQILMYAEKAKNVDTFIIFSL